MVNPILFDLGPIEIRYYGVLYALAFLVGYFILRKLARKFNIKEEYIDDYMPYIIIADMVSIPIALGAAFIRIGNFINSELVGKITDLPWAVQFLGYEGSRHPVQIYQATGHVIIFFILLSMTKLKNIKEGTIFWSLLFIDSIFRFVTEFYKDLPADYGFVYLGLNLAQWASLVIIMVSIKPLYDRFKL